jgi:ketosteroid isomerase-like protein
MKTITFITLMMISATLFPQEKDKLSDQIIKMEKAALERWNKGDVYGYLEICADDVVYFDPMLRKRMDGLDKLTAYYKPLQGLINVSRYEMIDPLVQASGSMAVLTFNLRSFQGNKEFYWNCTEVYRKEKSKKWKIIQSHWSIPTPEKEE